MSSGLFRLKLILNGLSDLSKREEVSQAGDYRTSEDVSS